MKAWFIPDQEWKDVKETDYSGGVDKDGYCTCPSCQHQKRILEDAIHVPDDLFRID